MSDLAGSSVKINPFSAIQNPSELGSSMSGLVALISRMAFTFRSVNDLEKSWIEGAIIVAFDKYGSDATISDVADYLRTQSDARAQDIGIQLYPFTRAGRYGDVFRGVTNIISAEDPVLQEFLLNQSDSSRKTLSDLIPFLFPSSESDDRKFENNDEPGKVKIIVIGIHGVFSDLKNAITEHAGPALLFVALFSMGLAVIVSTVVSSLWIAQLNDIHILDSGDMPILTNYGPWCLGIVVAFSLFTLTHALYERGKKELQFRNVLRDSEKSTLT